MLEPTSLTSSLGVKSGLTGGLPATQPEARRGSGEGPAPLDSLPSCSHQKKKKKQSNKSNKVRKKGSALIRVEPEPRKVLLRLQRRVGRRGV